MTLEMKSVLDGPVNCTFTSRKCPGSRNSSNPLDPFAHPRERVDIVLDNQQAPQPGHEFPRRNPRKARQCFDWVMTEARKYAFVL